MHLFTFENYLFRRHIAIESCNRSFLCVRAVQNDADVCSEIPCGIIVQIGQDYDLSTFILGKT